MPKTKYIPKNTLLENLKIKEATLSKWIQKGWIYGRRSKPFGITSEHYKFLKDQHKAFGGIEHLLTVEEAEIEFGMGLSHMIKEGIETDPLPTGEYQYIKYTRTRVKFKDTQDPKESAIFRYQLPETQKNPNGKTTATKILRKEAVDELDRLFNVRPELNKLRQKETGNGGYCPIIFYRSQNEGTQRTKWVVAYIEKSPGKPVDYSDESYDSFDFKMISNRLRHTRMGIDRTKIARFEHQGPYYNVLLAHINSPASFREECPIDPKYVINLNSERTHILHQIADEFTAERIGYSVADTRPQWFIRLVKAYKQQRAILYK